MQSVLRVRAAGLVMVVGWACGWACGCTKSAPKVAADGAAAVAAPAPVVSDSAVAGGYRGFDRNDYPGDTTMAGMRAKFAFTGYWLTPPPGETANSWVGKRDVLEKQGWGFLLLADGRLEAQILKAQKAGTTPADLGKKDAAAAVAAANNEGFPKGAILFLDQEEGGRLTFVQAGYLLAWTEAVAGTEYKPGVYASGEPVREDVMSHPNGDPVTQAALSIDTIQDIRGRITMGVLHKVEIFDAQDRCGPSPGCTMSSKMLSDSGEPGLAAWQYSQSPRRPELTKSCVQTYAADGNCYAPGFPGVTLDLDVARESDPSRAR